MTKNEILLEKIKNNTEIVGIIGLGMSGLPCCNICTKRCRGFRL